MPAIEHLLQYLGLFFASFLSATIIPFSSEAILSAMLLAGANAFWCLVWASLGNSAGGVTGYMLGYVGNVSVLERYLRVDVDKLIKWEKRIQKWGVSAAFFCWLPFVGDFIAVALGFFRLPLRPVLLFMFLGKTLRYAFIIFAYDLIFK